MAKSVKKDPHPTPSPLLPYALSLPLPSLPRSHDRHPRRTISAPATFRCPQRKTICMERRKKSACDAKNGACGVKIRRLQHRNMAHAVLVIDVIPIMSYILLCAHLRPISLYRCPLFSICFHFIPLLQSLKKHVIKEPC